MLKVVLNEVRSLQGPINLSELSHKLAIDKATLRGMILELERMGKVNTNFGVESKLKMDCHESSFCSSCTRDCMGSRN